MGAGRGRDGGISRWRVSGSCTVGVAGAGAAEPAGLAANAAANAAADLGFGNLGWDNVGFFNSGVGNFGIFNNGQHNVGAYNKGDNNVGVATTPRTKHTARPTAKV
ncbi:pentapeptide repeats family protein [Mycobacterium kansasii]|uniref:Pentapeptide repeats family protein n=1 Tax=Mycobacterium kansasii TaxID=1768 RepID=A0A1V3W8H4_MYCKA|nr:pentapeptide repeats family protein [Mycobacterium kansasii]